MISDCALRMGSKMYVDHAVCQDYCRSGMTPIPYAILADGCSSSPDTDIGARLLVCAAEIILKAMAALPGDFDGEIFYAKTLEHAAMLAKDMALSEQALDATLLVACFIDNLPTMLMYGDGLFAQRVNGNLLIHKVSFPSNAPNYISYRLNKKRYDDPTRGEGIIEPFELHPGGIVIRKPKEAFFGNFLHYFGEKNADFIAILSDGVDSFMQTKSSETSKSFESVKAEEVLPELLGFKNSNPGFAYRRMTRFLRERGRLDIHPIDDVSMGVIMLKE